MLVNGGFRGMLVEDAPRLSDQYGDLAQLMGMGMGGGFGGLPDDFRTYILQNQGGNAGETEALINNSDGLARVPDFMNRYNLAVALSQQVDQIRGDAAASALNTREQGIASNILNNLIRCRTYYPWGSVWGRTASNTAGLNAAISNLDGSLAQYLSEVKGMLDSVRAAIQAREEARARKEIEAQEAERQHQLALQQEAKRAQEEARTIAVAEAAKQAQAEQARATASAAAIVSQKEEIVAKLDFEKLIAKAQAPKIFGVPLSIAVPVMLAGTIGIVMVVMRKPAAPLSGYRRRRRLRKSRSKR